MCNADHFVYLLLAAPGAREVGRTQDLCDIASLMRVSMPGWIRCATTVLIPEALQSVLRRTLFRNGMTIARMFHYLMRDHKEELMLGAQRQRLSVHVRYQAAGLKLQRLHFRPDPQDWFELSQLAMLLGISRSMAFVCLLMLAEATSRTKPVGAPTYSDRPPFKWWRTEHTTIVIDLAFTRRQCHMKWRRRVDSTNHW